MYYSFKSDVKNLSVKTHHSGIENTSSGVGVIFNAIP